jgi:hypothetical protein
MIVAALIVVTGCLVVICAVSWFVRATLDKDLPDRFKNTRPPRIPR